MSRLVFDAIGTSWSIDILQDFAGNISLQEKEILSEIEKFDKIFSRFRDDSLVAEIYAKKGNYLLADVAVPLIATYNTFYNLSGGRFTPLIGQALEEAGYDKNYGLKPKKIHLVPEWSSVLDFKPPMLIVKKPVLLDFGAAGKGYLVDLIGEYLIKKNIFNFCIDAGGDILYRTREEKEYKIGMENPDNLKQIVGIIEIKNKSVCASSGNRRKWAQYHHILDPFSLVSPQGVKAVWTVADSAIIADAAATCMFMVEPEKLLTVYSFEYTILYTDNSFRISKNFPGKLFTN